MPQKVRKINSEAEYKAAIKLVRHFADGFKGADGYDLRHHYKDVSQYKRKKLQRYYELIHDLTSRTHEVKRPRNKKRLRSLQEFARHPEFPKGLKVAFLPSADPDDKQKIIYDKKTQKVKRVIEKGTIVRREVPFDHDLLIEDPSAAVQEVINKAKGKRYLIQAGEFDIPSLLSSDHRTLLDNVTKLMNKYGATDHNPDDSNSSYYENWMHGVISYDFIETTTWQQFLTEKNRNRLILKERRAETSRKKRRALLKKELKAAKLRVLGKKK